LPGYELQPRKSRYNITTTKQHRWRLTPNATSSQTPMIAQFQTEYDITADQSTPNKTSPEVAINSECDILVQ